MTEMLPHQPLNRIPQPANEAERLEALRRYNILDTAPEAAFDRITSLAARLFDVPIALVSLVDESRAWFKSCYGFNRQEVERDATICSFALLYDHVLVVPDTRQDERFVCNPFVQSEPGLRFYAGAPLLTHDGFNLGTLCLLDTKPRPALTIEQQATLQDLAAMVVDELELRLAARKVARLDTALLEVTQGVSVVTGEAFFYALTQHLAKVLGSDHVYIALLDGDNLDTIRSIAACSQGNTVANFAYQLQDTPCQQVIEQRRICGYPRGVQARFPRSALLKSLQVESYIAIPFFSSTGMPLGLLSVMDSNPLENVQLAESLLTIFALRIATELERQQTEENRTQTLLQEQRYSSQLRGLTEAALAMNSVLSIEEVLEAITEQAYTIIGAHQSVTSMTIDQNWAQSISSVYLSDKYAQWRGYDEQTDGSGIYACVCHLNRPMRLTQAELEAHPQWRAFGKHANQHPPLRGWLAAPLRGRDGHNIGLVQLSDKYEGEFTEEDEAILVQLAQMASVAIENTRLYEAEQQARTQAESANRIKDEFLAVLSHELRSPLNPILGWSQLLRSHKLDAKATDHALETIERNARLQTQLIEDLLDVSRILQGKLHLSMVPVDLVQMLESALETVRLAAEAKSIALNWVAIESNVLESEPGWTPASAATSPFQSKFQVMGDATRLQQVIWNLLSNAVKFTPSGGQVEIKLEQIESQVQIQVSDTGKGINPEFLPYIFDYFRQADSSITRSFGGLGLGLAIVQHLVKLHGGTVWAESEGEGQGTTFTVQLPLLRTPSHPQSLLSSPQTAFDLQGVRVLVVDDDEDVRVFVTFLLQQYGATVTTVASAAEALKAFAQAQPDILISDIGMPQVDGYALMRQVRQLPPKQGGQIPGLALTAYAGEIDYQQAISAGFQQHLAKPVEPEALIEAVANLVKAGKRELLIEI